jgi:membrane protein
MNLPDWVPDLPGWVRFLYAVFRDFTTDRGPQWAAAISYYGLLSVFPLLLAIITVGTVIFDPEPEEIVGMITEQLGDLLPAGEQEIGEIVEGAIEAGATVGIVSVMALMWSGSRVFSALTVALNIFFDVDEPYGFVKRTAIELGMLLSIGLFFVVALFSRWIVSYLWGALNWFPEAQDFLQTWLVEITSGVLLLLAIFLMYRFIPRRDVDWKVALLSAFLATLAIVLARPIFTGYVENFAEFNVIYGSLGVLVILIIWAWLTALLILLGAEFASHWQMLWIENKSLGEVMLDHDTRAPGTRQVTPRQKITLKHDPKSEKREAWRANSLARSKTRRTTYNPVKAIFSFLVSFTAGILFVQLFGWLRKGK